VIEIFTDGACRGNPGPGGWGALLRSGKHEKELCGGWKRRNWQTASKQPVKNVELWKQIDALAATHTIEWRWIKGHSGHAENERVDELANKGIDDLLGGSS